MSQLSRRALLSAFGAVPLVLAGCGGGGGSSGSTTVSFAASAMVNKLADQIITQTYSNLNTQAAALLAAVQALQAAPTDESLMDDAQAAWKATRVPWESSEGFIFGPVDALGIDPAIDSWPLNTPDLAAFLVTNPTPTQIEIETAGDDLRGFHAMEYLLFGDGVADNEKLASELTSAEVNYLVALAQAFKAKTQELVDAWTTSFNGGSAYAALLKTPGAGNASYSSYSAVVEELVNGVIGIADETGNTKMAEPLGTASPGDSSKVESQYSWNSLTDFHNNMQSILNVYTGELGFDWQSDTVSTSMNGLYAFVSAHNPTLANRVQGEIIDAQRKIALIKGDGDNTSTVITGSAEPFRNQIADPTGRTLIATAIAACNTLKSSLENDVLPLVGKTTFTS